MSYQVGGICDSFFRLTEDKKFPFNRTKFIPRSLLKHGNKDREKRTCGGKIPPNHCGFHSSCADRIEGPFWYQVS